MARERKPGDPSLDQVEVHFEETGFQGRIGREFDGPQLREFLRRGSRLFSYPGIELIAKGRNRVGILTISCPNGQPEKLVIKEFRVVGLDRLKTFRRASKAYKAWQGALELLTHQVLTPQPVAFLEKRQNGFVKEAIFITRMIPEASEIRGLLRTRREEDLRSLLRDLAEFLRQLHQRCLLHRDLSDGNIMVEERGQQRKFYLLDTNRLKKKKRLSSWSAIKSLIRIGVPPAEQKFFLRSYLGLAHLPFSAWAWYKINKECFNFYLKFKKFLGLRKIVQRLRIQ